MSLRRAAAALGAAMLLPSFAAPGAAEGFAGEWVRSEARREADTAALEEEIDRATEGLSIWTRGLSRALLRRHVRPTERYTIAEEDGALVIRSPETGSAWRVDGEPERGEGGETTSRLEAPDRIHQEWSHGDTHGTTRWQLEPGGEALHISVTAHHERLSEPLRYRTHYERVEAGSGPVGASAHQATARSGSSVTRR